MKYRLKIHLFQKFHLQNHADVVKMSSRTISILSIKAFQKIQQIDEQPNLLAPNTTLSELKR